jgi:hypothetical protein
MTNAIATSAAVSVDATVRIGKKSYALHDAMSHGAAVYDKLYLLQEQQLDYYRELGTLLIQVRALFKSDKLFGQYLLKSDLGSMSRQDRSDSMFIAANWAKVQKLNANGALESLGVSAIRKRLKAADKPKDAPKSAGNVSKGKSAQAAEPKAEPTVGSSDTKTTAKELAIFVKDMLKKNGITQAEFNKAMKA